MIKCVFLIYLCPKPLNAYTLKKEKDHSTEQKIKDAARQVFHKKGYAATRTRDIAEAAGLNLALLNYYFRSKEKLFGIVMLETLQDFFGSMGMVFNNPETSLEQKIAQIVERYLELFSREPEIPVFILSELRNDPNGILENVPINKLVTQSILFQQLKGMLKERNLNISPIHYIANLMGLIVFPFIGSPILMRIGNMDKEAYAEMIQERKTLIPLWTKQILATPIELQNNNHDSDTQL